jgi:hypothetical protein
MWIDTQWDHLQPGFCFCFNVDLQNHSQKKKTNLRGLSPWVNYTDRATAACQRSYLNSISVWCECLVTSLCHCGANLLARDWELSSPLVIVVALITCVQKPRINHASTVSRAASFLLLLQDSLSSALQTKFGTCGFSPAMHYKMKWTRK